MVHPAADRRRYQRIHASLVCRPAGLAVMTRRHPVDISLDGVRIYSDERFRVGELLTLEFILPNAPAGTVVAEVVWIRRLPPGSPADFDVGLTFRSMAPDQVSALKDLLGPLEWDPAEN